MIALVTTAIPPYGFDIQQVLGLPRHAHYRFRYLKNWFDPALWGKSLNDLSAAIILREKESGQFHLCRYVRIVETKYIGDVCYVEFSLQDYVTEAVAESAPKEIDKWFVEHELPSKGGQELPYLLFEHNGLLERPETGDSAWQPTLKRLSGIPMYKDLGFFRILELTSGGKEYFMETFPGRDSAFILEPGKSYSLRVAQYMPAGSGSDQSITSPFDVDLEVPAGFNKIRARQRVVGKYDVLRFAFDAPSKSAGTSGELAILTPQQGAAAKYGIQAMFLPVTVNRNSIEFWVRCFATAVGFGLYVCASPIAGSIPPLTLSVVQGIGVLLMAAAHGEALIEAILR